MTLYRIVSKAIYSACAQTVLQQRDESWQICSACAGICNKYHSHSSMSIPQQHTHTNTTIACISGIVNLLVGKIWNY